MSSEPQSPALSVPLSSTQREVLAVVLDLIIPASDDGRLPGAREFDVWGYLCSTDAQGARRVRDELKRLDRHATKSEGIAFASMPASQAAALVQALRQREPGFLSYLAEQTACCYYQQDRVLEAIGMEPRPPFPKGYEVEAGDLSLLEQVKRRGKIYRDI